MLQIVLNYHGMTLIYTLCLSISFVVDALLGRQAQWATLFHRKFHSKMILFEICVSTVLHTVCMQIRIHECHTVTYPHLVSTFKCL
jgi:hypothetical protein